MSLPDNTTRKLLRLNALASGILSLTAGLCYLHPSFPFPKPLAVVAVLGAACYFIYFVFFSFICKACYRSAGIILSQIGVVIITAAVYYTGGIVSPFIFLYFAILVSEAIYRLDNHFTMPAAITGYLLVISGHFFGFLPNLTPWSRELYRTPVAVLVIAGLTVSYIFITKRMSSLIVANLQAKISSEAAQKDELIRKFSELNATSQLGVLAHRIAHDMRGPIASVSGYLEMESAKEQTPEDRETLKDVQDTVDAMVASLHGITRFGKPGGPSSEKICLPDLLKDLVGIASFAPKARGVKFEVASKAGRDVWVTVARPDLQQALFNVIKNAVEAVADNPDDRIIDINITQDGRNAAIFISDNGPGAQAETLKNLFRRSVTTKADGTGVGLLITRDLLIRNKGDIKLRNREGGGFTAEISLPLA